MQLTNMLFLQGGARAGQGRAGQGRAGQGRAGQGRAGQGAKQHDIAQPGKALHQLESSPTHLFNAVCRFVYTFFFQRSAEMTEREDGGGPDVVLQVMRTEPGLKKKVGSV